MGGCQASGPVRGPVRLALMLAHLPELHVRSHTACSGEWSQWWRSGKAPWNVNLVWQTLGPSRAWLCRVLPQIRQGARNTPWWQRLLVDCWGAAILFWVDGARSAGVEKTRSRYRSRTSESVVIHELRVSCWIERSYPEWGMTSRELVFDPFGDKDKKRQL